MGQAVKYCHGTIKNLITKKRKRYIMTKKYYELLVQALKGERELIDHELIVVNGLQVTESAGKRKEWANITKILADSLAQDNPRFNRAKFLQACGYND